MADNIKLLKNYERDSMKAAIELIKRDLLPNIAEHASVIAQIRRANYLALIDEGFNEEQALLICTKPMTL